MLDVSVLAKEAAAGEPGDGLPAVAVLRRLLEHLEAAQVGQAKALGWSWQEVADSLGVSRQAVHKKYSHRLTPP